MQENREIFQEEDKIKLATEAAKAPIDHTTLQLHNLLYEKNHYVKAIKTCKDFRSKYPDIDLVSEEAFFQDAPQELQTLHCEMILINSCFSASNLSFIRCLSFEFFS
jgi:THO complex subunit 5